MKVINSAGFAAFNFSIDGHALWILKLDGQPVVPQKVTDILINAAQRVDLALCRISGTYVMSIARDIFLLDLIQYYHPLPPSFSFLMNSGPNSSWIRSEMNQDVFGYESDTSGVLAILTYTTEYAAYSSTSDPITGSAEEHSVNGHHSDSASRTFLFVT